ncbi:MAG: DUF4340 domain-containing protein [Cyanobacteria bacterium P01_A01_bin.123]
MKFQRNTVILVGVAAVLSVMVLISEARRSRTDALNGTGEAASRDRLFSFEEADVTQLTIEKDGQTLMFERDENSTWQMLEPETALAEQAAIAYLLNLTTTSGPSRVFTIEPDQQDNFGLNSPTANITFTLASGQTHTLLLGTADFSGGSLYAVVDVNLETEASAPDAIEVEVVPIDFVNAVTRPLSEWQATVDEPEPGADSETNSETNSEADSEDSTSTEDIEESSDPEPDDANTNPEAPKAPEASNETDETDAETSSSPETDPENTEADAEN